MDDAAPPPSPTPEPAPEPVESPALDPVLVTGIATALAFGTFLVTSLVTLVNVAFGLWFTQVFAFIGVGWYVLRATGRGPLGSTGLGAPRWAPMAFGLVVGVANLLAVAVPLQYLSRALMPVSWREIYNVEEIFRGQPPLETALIVVGVGFLKANISNVVGAALVTGRRDAFIGVAAKSIMELPPGAAVGSSSLRRQALILRMRPDLRVVGFRGNVQTRLRKLQEGVADESERV